MDWLEELIGNFKLQINYKANNQKALASAIRAEMEKRLDGLNALDDNGYLMALKDIRKALGLKDGG